MKYTVDKADADFLEKVIDELMMNGGGTHHNPLVVGTVDSLYRLLLRHGINKCKEMLMADFASVQCPTCKQVSYIVFDYQGRGLWIQCERTDYGIIVEKIEEVVPLKPRPKRPRLTPDPKTGRLMLVND